MARDDEQFILNDSKTGQFTIADIVWTISRARATQGYNVCTLKVNGVKVAQCNGGGYDMVGSVFGDHIAKAYADRLREGIASGDGFYGLTFHDPNYDSGKTIIEIDGEKMAVDEAEKCGKSLGLDRYQSFYKGSSPVATERHTVPSIDGSCGFESVQRIASAIGIELMSKRRYDAIQRYKAEEAQAAHA